SISNDPSTLPTSGPSAMIGQPPANLRDYYIVKGLFRMVTLNDANPMMGYFLAVKPPSGYVHESRAPGILVGMLVVITAIVLPTATRLILRLRQNKMKFDEDDWAILAAVFLAVVFPTLQIVSLFKGGGGQHTWEITYEVMEYGNMTGYICKITFYQAVSVIKLSIALFVRRLADPLLLKWRWFCDVFIGSVVAYMLVALFWTIFACDTPRAQWSLYERGRLDSPPHCLNTKLQSQVLGGIHLAQGIMLASAPIFILWKVRMNRAKKMRLYIYWITGGITILGGLLRTIRPGGYKDVTWEFVEVLGWTCLDLVLGIITASLPILDGMFSDWWNK
ncbi:hypothetical protein P153DRAFT_250873, partial [Dothidotthia symphoricarpi CBS 119687]